MVIQGDSDQQRELSYVESVAGHLLEPGSVLAVVAEHRDRLFPSELFADLFPSGRGRPRGYAIDAKGFYPSTLTYWRRRLASSGRLQRIEMVHEVIAETGAVKHKTRRAVDSTVLDDAVARQDSVPS